MSTANGGGLSGAVGVLLPRKKRFFDVLVCVLAAPILIPVFLLCMLAVLVFSGLPVFYVSVRRTHGRTSRRIVKFRAMMPNADRLVNRDAMASDGQSFLNLSPSHEAYTAVGRWLERCCFTELPQVWHVLRGHMTLVGNRPLPESVITALKEHHADVERRFELPGGIAGPIQLVGRERISDADRIRLEIAYCQACERAYAFRIDFLILMNTVLVCLRVRRPFSVYDLERWLRAAGAQSLRHYVPLVPWSPARSDTALALTSNTAPLAADGL